MVSKLSENWLNLAKQVTAFPAPGRARTPRMSLGETLFNRDLTWLNFNDRVLNEAMDETVPPLERLRFATIVSSNLDEFFMVRVAEIARIAARAPTRAFPDGLTASQVMTQIREHALRQKAGQAEVLDQILGVLRKNGIHIYTQFGRDPTLDREIKEFLPEINVVLRRSSDPFPPLLSEKIHIFIQFPGEYAVLTIQDRESRLVQLTSTKRLVRYALVDRWMSDRASLLFPGREVIEAFPFKIIRDADLRYRPDDEETLEEQIVEAVHGRTHAKVIRLEVDAPSYSEGAIYLGTQLGLDSAALYRFDLPLDLRTLSKIYGVKAPSKLRYPSIRPQIPLPFRKRKQIFELIRRKDILLHHPYDSFDIVVNFIAQAARDPRVTKIYHMMYRTNRDSPIMESLKEAARRGKRVTAYVEVKARFDELNNVRWADELRRAGVRVVRHLGGYKVHSKATQVFRKESDGEVSYLHLGTGNYNPITARQYTDLSLLTFDHTLANEISMYFAILERRQKTYPFLEILVAPDNLHDQILKLIRQETRIQRMGGRGHIVAKMNSLVDPDIIHALYEASGSGVKVDLIVRGICCLRPGIKGLSDNIRVVSVVDRFLEHSRIYYFRAGGAEKVFLSSADWMPRNFYSRFEIAFPIKDAALKKFVRDVILGNALSDNIKSWALLPDGGYIRIPRAKGSVDRRSQFIFEALAKNEYRGTVLEHRLPTRVQ